MAGGDDVLGVGSFRKVEMASCRSVVVKLVTLPKLLQPIYNNTIIANASHCRAATTQP